jgi:hypothetical protein
MSEGIQDGRDRPLGVIVDDVFRLYAEVLPRTFLVSALGALVGGIMLSIAIADLPQPPTPANIDWGALLPGWLVQLLVGAVLQGMLLRMIDARFRGDAMPSLDDAFRAGMAMLPTMVGATLFYALLAGLGTMLLILPGIWIMVAAVLYAPAVALEGAGPVAATSRSRELLGGAWWRTFGLMLLMFLVAFVGYLMVAAIVGPLARIAFGAGWPVEVALGTVFGGAFAPLMNSTLVVLYRSRLPRAAQPAAPPPSQLVA